MKKLGLLLSLGVLGEGAVLPAQAQSRIYRCGNEYTNSAERIRQGGCVALRGGNVTVVRGGTIHGVTGGSASVVPAVASPRMRAQSRPAPLSNTPTPRRIEDTTQRTREAGARAILQAEWQRTTQKLADLRREYNNGEPERMGSETHNYQKYLERVAGLRASIQRAESDLAGLRRELGRAGG